MIDLCKEREMTGERGWTWWGTLETESSPGEGGWGVREGIVVDRKREASTVKENGLKTVGQRVRLG